MHRKETQDNEHPARGQQRRRLRRDGGAGETVAEGAVENATRQSVRKGVTSMLVAAAVLLMFNSSGLRSWARGLPGNAATDVLVEVADGWHGMMRRARLTAATAAVREAVAAFRDQGWPPVDTPSEG